MNKGRYCYTATGRHALTCTVARGNCAIKLGDLVHVSAANDIKYGKR